MSRVLTSAKKTTRKRGGSASTPRRHAAQIDPAALARAEAHNYAARWIWGLVIFAVVVLLAL